MDHQVSCEGHAEVLDVTLVDEDSVKLEVSDVTLIGKDGVQFWAAA